MSDQSTALTPSDLTIPTTDGEQEYAGEERRRNSPCKFHPGLVAVVTKIAAVQETSAGTLTGLQDRVGALGDRLGEANDRMTSFERTVDRQLGEVHDALRGIASEVSGSREWRENGGPAKIAAKVVEASPAAAAEAVGPHIKLPESKVMQWIAAFLAVVVALGLISLGALLNAERIQRAADRGIDAIPHHDIPAVSFTPTPGK